VADAVLTPLDVLVHGQRRSHAPRLRIQLGRRRAGCPEANLFSVLCVAQTRSKLPR
jgi:hypothetical protein